MMPGKAALQWASETVIALAQTQLMTGYVYLHCFVCREDLRS